MRSNVPGFDFPPRRRGGGLMGYFTGGPKYDEAVSGGVIRPVGAMEPGMPQRKTVGKPEENGGLMGLFMGFTLR